MPCYAALALLLGAAIAEGGVWVRRGTRALSVVAACGAAATLTILFLVRHVPAPGDIASALSSNPYAYTMALGHMSDLTINSFAYLRAPLIVASVAFLIGALGMFRPAGQRAFLATALMMVLFFHAAHMALVVFDPYLSSRPLADALTAFARRNTHHRRALLPAFVNFFLHESGGIAVGRGSRQPGIRFVRAGRAGCFCERRSIEESMARARSAAILC